MTKLFGLPMQNIMLTLLVITAVCLSSVGFVAWRNRTMFWLGLRNIPRRKAQTTLIVFGLMLATVIITSALAIGDTLAYSVKKQVYDQVGTIDLVVVKGAEERGRVARLDGTAAYFDRATYEALRGKVGGAASIDGLAPVLVELAPALNQTSKQSEPVATILGIEPGDAAALGGVIAREGGAIDLAALGANELVLNEALAESLGAKPGDAVAIFTPQGPQEYRVARIARDGGLGGYSNQVKGAIILPAARVQALAGPEATGKYNQLLVSAKGDAAGGLQHEAEAKGALQAAVAGTGLAVDPIKRQAIDQAELLGNTFTSFFLIFGLFAIAAGVMLIFLIFVMLAAERRGEMGMARAVGTKRRHLIQSFVAEGAAYDILAAAVGAGLGVGIAFGIAKAMASLFGQELAVTPHVEPRSLVVAYCLGVVVTFITIAVSAWRVSRLNIVAAIRDLEDAKKPGGGWRGLVFGILGIAIGGFLWANAGTRAFTFTFGVSLIILSSTLVLSYFRLPGRFVYTLAGLTLSAFWALPTKLSDRIFGKYQGGPEMSFVAGIMMVAGAVLLLINNGDLILAATNRLGAFAQRFIPALKMGTAYPLASRFRTGLTMYMFALIIFVLVLMTSIQVNFDRIFNDPGKSQGGWDVTGQTLPDTAVKGGSAGLRAALERGNVPMGDIAAIGGLAPLAPSQVQVKTIASGKSGNLGANGVDTEWLSNTQFSLQARADGYGDDASVWRAMQANPNLVVVDITATASDGFGGAANTWRAEGITDSTRTFAPIQIELRSTETNQTRALTVIGVTDAFVGSANGMYINQQTFEAIFGPQPVTNYYFKLKPGVDAKAMAQKIEAATLQNGMQAESIAFRVQENNRQSNGFFSLLKGFIGLGLVVGIAALGVVAFRAVVERRQQIGMLRAIGFGRSMVTTSFLIESLFVTLLGILAGMVPALVLASNLFTGGEFGNTGTSGFMIPWNQIAMFAGIALIAALAMTIIPSRQAGNVQPAEALRYE
ncbi:MAG: FtsX-like permease family protein [Thermomicrobiales bacterium]